MLNEKEQLMKKASEEIEELFGEEKIKQYSIPEILQKWELGDIPKDSKVILVDKAKELFPLSAPYKQDKFEFAKSYIRTMRKWATENLGVEAFKE
jgi:hypothetical protein